jgi:hypothetical protein
VEQGKASCSSDQLRQALQYAAGDGETVSGTPSRKEVRRAVRFILGVVVTVVLRERELIVVTTCEYPISRFANPNPIYTSLTHIKI